MINITDNKKCCGCGACYSICPKKSITMKFDSEGFLYPRVNGDTCVGCGLCEKVCQFINTNKVINAREDNSYACVNKNEYIRLKSSSGGLFYVFAQYVLCKNGVVFGASYDDKFKVCHTFVQKEEELQKLMGSKYVQSEIGDCYNSAKEFLEMGRFVLFSGTPCQILGLKNFLGKNYEKLVCIDVVCHGTPTPKVLEKFIRFYEKKENSKLKEMSFRDKTQGWKKLCLYMKFQNGTVIRQNSDENAFFKGFLTNLYLRPSCHNCHANGDYCASDITMADYWGVDKIHKELDDGKGVSLILVNTQLGKKIFSEISKSLQYEKTDYYYALKCNPCITQSSKKNSKRKKFFRECYESLNIEETIFKYTTVSCVAVFYDKIKWKIISIKNKVGGFFRK